MDIAHGLEGVVVDTTRISLVDGKNGILSYRGRSIDELVDLPFGHVAALVVDGETGPVLSAELRAHSALSSRECELVLSLPANTHPMHVLQGMTPLLDRTEAFADRGEAAQGFAVAAKLPTLLATFLRQAEPAEVETTDPAMIFLEQSGALLTPIARQAYNTTQILQIEHSFNASTFVARSTASTLAPVESALSAAFGALHGVLHGGADQAALETADQVGCPEKAAAFVDACLENGTKVMGMGHREYRVLDPRARHLKALAEEEAANMVNEEGVVKFAFFLYFTKLFDDFMESDLYNDFIKNVYNDMFTMLRNEGYVENTFNWCTCQILFNLFFRSFIRSQLVSGIAFNDLQVQFNDIFISILNNATGDSKYDIDILFEVGRTKSLYGNVINSHFEKLHNFIESMYLSTITNHINTQMLGFFVKS